VRARNRNVVARGVDCEHVAAEAGEGLEREQVCG
jgi:hypothetical protein